MIEVIGRKYEKEKFKEFYELENSEFLVVYGRRRVGKTFLIREYFADRFFFYLTGLANSTTVQQLANFQITINEQFNQDLPLENSWLLAFEQLKAAIKKSRQKKKGDFYF